jgi:hypothetical protein
MVPHSDYFNTVKLSPEWSLLGYGSQLPWSLSVRPGWVRLSPRNQQNTLLKTDAEHNYSLITRLDFAPKATTDEAGIRIITGLQTLSASLYSSANSLGDQVIKFSFGSTIYEAPNTAGNVVWLKMARFNHMVSGFFSTNGFDWTLVGKSIDVKSMDIQQANSNAWTGNRQGIYVKGSAADFDLYIYRDAYTSILAETTANQSGTAPNTAILDQIHSNDWAMYAGVEFGDADYPVQAVSFEANASSVFTTGVIEVWLDSLQSGRKIAECPITSTGSLAVYKFFSTSISEITGTHDVYLKFRGEGTDKLYQLKSFRFLGKLKPVTANLSKLPDAGQLMVFPNPATHQVTVTSKEPYSSVRILNLNGALVHEYRLEQATMNHIFPLQQPAGTYLLEISTTHGTTCTRLVIL